MTISLSSAKVFATQSNNPDQKIPNRIDLSGASSGEGPPLDLYVKHALNIERSRLVGLIFLKKMKY
jgi:hypothetical protein